MLVRGGVAKEGLDLKMSSDLTLIWHQTKSDIILSECWDGWGLCVWLNRYNKKDFKFLKINETLKSDMKLHYSKKEMGERNPPNKR